MPDLGPLQGLTALQTISFWGMQVSEEEIDALRAVLPNVMIYSQ